jgi:hypothetical protein
LIRTIKEKFSKFFNKLLDNTAKPKFIIISHNREDLDIEHKLTIEIEPFNPVQAAKLMMKIAGDSVHLKPFKDAE